MSNHEPLRDALRRRADRVGDTSPLTLDDVKGRARGIRRRQVAVSGLAAAAVVAVAVPVGIAVTDRTTGPSDPPVAGPSTTPSEDGTTTPDSSPVPKGPQHVTLTTEVDGSSYEAGIPYLYDGAIYLPGGDQVAVDGPYSTFAPLGDGWVASGVDDEGNWFTQRLDAVGDVTDNWSSTGPLATSGDGTAVAFATPDGELMTVATDSAPAPLVDAAALPGGALEPVGMTGSKSCDQDAAGGGCAVFFNSQDGAEQGAWSATAKGIVSPFEGLLAVEGTAPDGSLSGLVSVSDTGSCSVVLDRAWEQSWKTCDYTLGQFSPDGRYVIGHPAYRDGIGDGSVAILDAATGDLVAEATNSEEHPSFINNVVWDTDNTLVMTVFEKDTWAVMRMTPTGELSAIIPKIGDNMDEVPVRLPTQP